MIEPHWKWVSIQTVDGSVEGRLHVGSLRTLDDLNLAPTFVVIHDPREGPTDWLFGDGPLAINKSTIVFVTELPDDAPPRTGAARGRYMRAFLSLRAGEFGIQGCVHVPWGGDPMKRLNQEHTFLALTSVSVLGPDSEYTAAFLAVNRTHITAAQPMGEDREEPATNVAEADAFSS